MFLSFFFFICRIRELGLSFENMFEEIPVVIRNSHLMNVTLCEIEDKLSTKKTFNNLDMATGYVCHGIVLVFCSWLEPLTNNNILSHSILFCSCSS